MYTTAHFTRDLKKAHRKPWTYKTDNKLRGAYGETDYKKKQIRINKKAHRAHGMSRITPNKDGSENMLTSMYHEELHRKHPDMSEKRVRKLEKAAKRLTRKAKARLYNKFK